MTQVTLGNFFSVNGKTVLGGIGGSGLDTQSLITSLVATKSAPATQDQDKIKVNDAQSAALNSFQSLLSTFQSAADALRNAPGVGNAADNVFKFTTGTVTGAGSNFVSLTTSPGATLQSYNISDISQLASASRQSSGVFTVASADASAVSANPISGTALQFAAGTITVNGQNITLREGDSLNTVAATFNAVKDQSGISATVIQLQSGQYQLSFASTQTGAASSFDLSSLATVTSDPSGVLSNIGLTQTQTLGNFNVTSADDDVTPPALGSTVFAPGTIHFNGADITVNADDSLNDIAASFNAQKGTTGVTAHVIQLDTNQFTLSFTANPGASTFDLSTATDPSGVLDDANIGDPVDGSAASAGLDAHFKLNGISISRSTNNINDVVSGVTFNLLGTTDAVTNYVASVQPDTTTIQNTIVAYVNAYNAIKTFEAQQTQTNSDGTFSSTAVLATDETFRSAMSGINSQVIAQVAGIAGSNPKSLADIGITLTTLPATSTAPAVNNVLTVNDSQLSSALATNFNGVKNVFGFNMTSNSPDLAVFSETNSLNVSQFSITKTGGTFTATYNLGDGPVTVGLTAAPLNSIPGYTLTGQSGTALDGMVLIYASNTDGTFNVTTTQGIADRTYNTSNATTKANTGTVAIALKTLQTSDATLNDDIANVNAQVAQYQQQLLKQFAALESAVSNVNNLLNSLAANDNARLTASGH